ncbi:putative transmembrane anti-sigma factor [Pandoraea terrae]|uniref:Putative transmembrane anti-sigma factor n=1 Tax=Pandoraea terrae TaxID=1537710 RepID=A0A5E4SPS8_9BURK|nr:anti-sigma factor [Pandoraea terrae]VVD77720.1 putative transmembrane anti-sigma factor [Pandoraea terrae]
MKVDDVLLLAYVDGELPPEARQALEARVAASPELAETVARLRASVLPYAQAFEAQALPPLPDSLTKNIEAMVREHAFRATPSANDMRVTRAGASGEPVRSRLRPSLWWTAGAFAAGVACCALALQLMSALSVGPNGGGATIASAPAKPVTWVRAAAEYQQLYTRDTVARVVVDPDATAQTVQDIQRNDGLAVRVPDLRQSGLSFKHVQRLRFRDQPLVQMVYLPERGDPVALCVVKDPRPDQDVTEQRIDNMGVVMWRRGQLGYALIGAPGSADLVAIAKRLAEDGTAPLYGQVATPGAGVGA